MDILFFMFLAAGATAVGLAMLAIWAPRPTRVRLIASGVAILFLPTVISSSPNCFPSRSRSPSNGMNANAPRPRSCRLACMRARRSISGCVCPAAGAARLRGAVECENGGKVGRGSGRGR